MPTATIPTPDPSIVDYVIEGIAVLDIIYIYGGSLETLASLLLLLGGAGSENALPELAKPPCIFCLGTDTRQTEVRCVEVEAMDMDMDCSELTPSS